MKCITNQCSGSLHVTHTYQANGIRYQRAVCPVCNRPFRLETLAHEVKRRGDGARAAAKKALKTDAGCTR